MYARSPAQRPNARSEEHRDVRAACGSRLRDRPGNSKRAVAELTQRSAAQPIRSLTAYSYPPDDKLPIGLLSAFSLVRIPSIAVSVVRSVRNPTANIDAHSTRVPTNASP